MGFKYRQKVTHGACWHWRMKLEFKPRESTLSSHSELWDHSTKTSDIYLQQHANPLLSERKAWEGHRIFYKRA